MPNAPSKSIAVLPFVNMSSSLEHEYFSDGMTEELINALAKIEGLKVTSRTSSFHFKNKNIPIPQIGEALGVSIILEGSIRLSGEKMRLTAQLIDVVEDFHFFSETFDRSVEDIFEVQDEISLLIADKLREHLGHLEIDERLVDKPPVPVNAYKDYLKSRYHILKMNKADIDKGISILEGVVTEFPDYPLARLGLHLAYTLLGTIGLTPASEAFAMGKIHLNKAIVLNPALPECQLQLSYVAFLEDWDLPAAYRHLNKVKKARPVPEYYQSMASILVAEGKTEAAMNYIETSLQLDPFSAINYHLKGFILYTQRKYEQAIECFEKALELQAGFMAPTLYLGQAYILTGRLDESLEFFQKLPDVKGDLLRSGGITLTYASMGKKSEVEAGVQQLKAALDSELMDRALHFLVLIHAIGKDQVTAMKWMEQALGHKLPLSIYYFVDPLLDTMRNLSRFKELAKAALGDNVSVEPSGRKYKKELFDQVQLNRYKSELIDLMEQQEPHLDPALTLRHLAQMINLPLNHMSQLLNEGFDRNFSAFVNQYRLEAFKVKAQDPKNRNLTILSLAYDSGFNSKTVFNTYFKKVMGITPKKYWKEVASE